MDCIKHFIRFGARYLEMLMEKTLTTASTSYVCCAATRKNKHEEMKEEEHDHIKFLHENVLATKRFMATDPHDNQCYNRREAV